MKKVFTLTLTVLCANVVNAQIRYGTPVYGGIGCLNNDVFVELPMLYGNRGLGKILFDKFLVNSSRDKNLISRKACNIRVPVTVDDGYQLAVRIADAAGWVRQSSKVTSTLTAKASFVGAAATQAEIKTWKTAINTHFQLASDLIAKEINWSSCLSKELILTLNNNILSQRQKVSQASQLSVDQINFEILVRRCN